MIDIILAQEEAYNVRVVRCSAVRNGFKDAQLIFRSLLAGSDDDARCDLAPTTEQRDDNLTDRLSRAAAISVTVDTSLNNMHMRCACMALLSERLLCRPNRRLSIARESG